MQPAPTIRGSRREGYLVAPLYRFELKGVEDVALKDARILPVTSLNAPSIPEECDEWLRQKVGAPRWIIEMRVRDEWTRRTLDRALLALKLFKNAYVQSHYVYPDRGGRDAWDKLRHYVSFDQWSSILDYQLLGSEIEALSRHWELFVEVDPGLFPAYRFHLAEFRPYDPDRFVDYIQCLESLFVPDDTAAKGKKLRERAAVILGDGSDEGRTRLCQQVHAAWGLRSSIVHGDAYSRRDVARRNLKERITDQGAGDMDGWWMELHWARNLARRALRFFVESDLLDSDKRKKYLQEVGSRAISNECTGEWSQHV